MDKDLVKLNIKNGRMKIGKHCSPGVPIGYQATE